MAAFHIAAAAEPVEPLAEWDSESLGSAPPDPDAANLAGCWQDEEEDAEELRRRSAKAALAAKKKLNRKRMSFARQAEASNLAALIAERKRKKREADERPKREADEEVELAEQLDRQRVLLAGADIRAATFSSLQRLIAAEDGRADLYRAELSPAEAQRAEAREPAVQAACDSARELFARTVLDAQAANVELGRADAERQAAAVTQSLENKLASYEWVLKANNIRTREQVEALQATLPDGEGGRVSRGTAMAQRTARV